MKAPPFNLALLLHPSLLPSSQAPGQPALWKWLGEHTIKSTLQIQLLTALYRANKMDSTIPWILAVVSFPVMMFKQGVNVIQIVKASQWLAQGDLADRAKLGLPAKKTQ